MVGALLVASLASAEVGQRVRFQTYSTAQGLSQASAASLLFDRHGFLWIGTQDGLNRFDGLRFVVFHHDPNNPNSIAENNVTALAEDRAGNLWVGGPASLSRMGLDGRVSRFDDSSGFAGGAVQELLATADGAVIVSTRSAGAQRFDAAAGRFAALPGLPTFQRRQRALALDTDGSVLLAHDHRLLRWRPDGFDEIGAGVLPVDSSITAIVRRASGELAVATQEHGLYLFAADGSLRKSFAPRELPAEVLRTLIEDNAGRLWIGSVDGVMRIEDDQVSIFRHVPGLTYGLPSGDIVEFARDTYGALYVGTWTGGFARTDPQTEAFVYVHRATGQTPGLPVPPVAAIAAAASGEVYVGQLDGGGLTRIAPDFAASERIDLGPLPRRRDIMALKMDGPSLILGYGRGGIDIWSPGAALGEFQQSGLPNVGVLDLRRDNDGTLWVGTLEGGLFARCAECDAFVPMQVPLGDSPRAQTASINHSLETRNGWSFIAMARGLAYRASAAQPWRIIDARSAPLRLPHESVTWLLETNDDELYAGTQGGGMVHIARSANGEPVAVSSFDERHGLVSSMIGAILEDRRKRLWVSTTRGLCLFRPDAGRAQCLGYLDPILTKDNYIASAAQGPGGAMYFGGPEGMVVVPAPENFDPPTPKATLALTDLRIANETVPAGSGVLTSPLADAAEIALAHDQDVVSIEFAALNLSASTALRYTYQLLGRDPQPIPADASRRIATFTDLPAGRYVLEINAIGIDGAPLAQRRLGIDVEPSPYWSAPARWAYLLMALALVALIAWRVRLRQSERARAEQALAQSEALLNHTLWGSSSELWDADLSTPQWRLRRRNRLEHLKVTRDAKDDSLMAYAPFVHVEDRDAFGKALKAAVRGDVDLFEAQYRVQDVDGDWRWLYTRGRVFARNADGRALRLVGTTLDVTDIRARDSALRLSEERLKLAIWGSGDELWDIDFQSGTVRRENPLPRTLLANEAVFPKLSDYLAFVHPDDREKLTQSLTSHVKGQTEHFECGYRTKDLAGGWVWILGKGRVVARDAKGFALRMVGTNRDVTELKRAEDALRELNEELESRVERRTEALAKSNRELQRTLDELTRTQKQLVESEKLAALGGLVAGVAHEINTPLGVGVTAASHLQAEAQVMGKRLAEGRLGKSDLLRFIEQATQSADLVLRNLDRASQLVRSFKQVAVDQSSEQRREFRLRAYLGEILLSLQPRIRKIDVTVDIECPESLALDTYPGAIYQIVVNLVINSLVHGFEGRSGNVIRIEAWCEGDRVILDYRDNGKGMSEAVQRRVFEPFFTTRRGSGGSGLGMHIVYNLTTQLLGGEVSCDSTEGKGTHFRLRIPRVAPQEAGNAVA